RRCAPTDHHREDAHDRPSLPVRSAHEREVVLSRRSWGRARSMSRAIGVGPTHRAVVVSHDPPSVLVNQLVVERADQHEVVQIGGTAIAPPPDVVSLGEPSGSTAREAALPGAVADLADHPGGRLPGEPAEPEDATMLVL